MSDQNETTDNNLQEPTQPTETVSDASEDENVQTLAVVVDQDNNFLRVELDGEEATAGEDFDLVEEQVEKEVTDEASGEDSAVSEDEKKNDDSESVEPVEQPATDYPVRITVPAVAEAFGSDQGVFMEDVSEVESKVFVNGEVRVVGKEVFERVQE